MAEGRRTPWVHNPKTFLFAAAVGVIGGFVGTLFQLGSYGLQHLLIGPGSLLAAALQLPWWKAVAIPFLGGIAATLITWGLTRRHKAQGMSDVMEAVNLKRVQMLRPTSVLARAASSLALIATGGSVGREGPIVYMSASFGSALARLGRFAGPRLGLFAGCGVAAGMSSAYFAPFGATLFAMEVVLGNFAVDILAPVVLASVISSLVVRGLASPDLLGHWMKGPPVYHLPKFEESLPSEYLIYLLLGFCAAAGAWLFVRALHSTESLFRRMPVPVWARLPIGGLLVGVLGIGLPHVWGNGYDAVNLVLKETPTLQFVVLLFLAKILATSVTIGSGGSGGIFTPTMFIGSALGLLVGSLAQLALPGVVDHPPHYACVGMAAMLAATTHAPIMAMFLLFEMTRETAMILPMMVACITASETARFIGVESVYVEPLRRRGLHVPQGIEETTLSTTRVTDVMREEFISIRHTATFDQIVAMIAHARRDTIYVVGELSQLVGAIRLHDVKNFLADRELGAAVIAADLAVELPRAHPNQTLAELLDVFDDPELHELPVTDPLLGNLLGILDRRDLISALSVDVLHRPSLRAKFVEPEGTQHYVELPRGHALARIPIPADLVGRTLGETDFRRRTDLTVLTVVRTVRGRDQRLHPSSGLVFEAGDAMIVMGPVDSIREQGGEA